MAPSSHLPNQDCKTVFIIDGDPDSADTLVSLFDILGHRVVSVEDNARLRAALSQTVPDIAIVNLDTIKLDWRKTALLLRAVAPRDKLKMLALTGWGLGDYASLCRALGYDECLSKPVGFDVLCARLGIPGRINSTC